MNEKQAIAKLKKIVGPKLAWRKRPDAPDAEARRELRDRCVVLRAEFITAHDAMNERRAQLLNGDAEYQRLKSEYEQARKRRDDNAGLLLTSRVTVGKLNTLAGIEFFEVLAEGDNWQEVVDKLAAKEEA